MNWFVGIVIVLIVAITILISIFSYRDWKENFPVFILEIMLGYERKKKGDGNES
jgi:hypothetical protein